MASSDWRSPFLAVREQFKQMYDTHIELYHGVILLPDRDGCDSSRLDEIEAAADGRQIYHRFVTPTDSSVYHAHYFCANKPLRQSNFDRFAEILSGAESWIRKIPGFPRFIKHPIEDQSVRDVIAWTNLVYYLAGRLNRPYLSVMVEHYNGDYFETWKTWPKPMPVNLLPALLHEQDPIETVLKLSSEFETEGYALPCMIDAYLEGSPMISDLVQASAVAVDCLLYMLDGLNKSTETSSRKHSRNRSTSQEVKNEVRMLGLFLAAKSDQQVENEEERRPLTQKEIAIGMQWTRQGPNGLEPDEVKVTRRMQAIFGNKPQAAYEATFRSGKPILGIRTKRNDGSFAADGVVEPDEDDLD